MLALSVDDPGDNRKYHFWERRPCSPTSSSGGGIAHACAPMIPLVAGSLAFVGLFWVGHLGVREATGDTNRLAEAEMESALAVVATDPEPHLERLPPILAAAGETRLLPAVSATISSPEVPQAERLATLVALYSERRSARQHEAEQRFLALSSAGIVLLALSAIASFWLWRGRWNSRWKRVRRLSSEVEALARAPLDAQISRSGSRDEIGRVEEALSQLAPELAQSLVHQQRLSLLGEQLAFVAHDMRNPIASISMGISLIPEDALDAEIRELLSSETARLTALAEDLRSFARKSDATAMCDVKAEAEATMRALKQHSDRARVSITLCATASTPVRSRANEIRQVLVNLLENAIHAAALSNAAAASLSLSNEGGMAVIVVEDSGSGIPAGERDRVFDSFYTSKEGGSGMGLAISRRIVESLGGTIQLGASATLGGASFRIILPSAPDGEEPRAENR